MPFVALPATFMVEMSGMYPVRTYHGTPHPPPPVKL